MIESAHRHHRHEHTHGVNNHHHDPSERPGRREDKNGFVDRLRRRRELRFEEKIFQKAIKHAQKEPSSQDKTTLSTLPDDTMDKILAVAKRVGKEEVLLNTTKFSDQQIEIFSQEFAKRINEKKKSKLFKRTTVVGNGAIGTLEGLTAGGSSAILVDWIHNWIDAYIYNEQLNNVTEPDSVNAKNYRRRKAFFTLYASTSALLAAKAGIDFGIELTTDHEPETNPLAIYTTGASVALNVGLGLTRLRKMQRMKKNDEHATHHDHDVNTHFAIDTASASLAFVGAVAGSSLLGPTAGIVSGGLGAYFFFPSEKNLKESYHSHDNEEEHSHHEHTEEDHYEHDHHLNEENKIPKQRNGRFKAAVAAVASVAVLATAGIVGAKSNNDTNQAHWHQGEVPAMSDLLPEPPKTQPSTEIPLTECVTAKQGDSRWEIAQQRIETATGGPTKDAIIYPTVIFATEATITNPHLIDPNDCISVPTPAVAKIIHETITHPETADANLLQDLKTLSNQPSIEVATQKKQGTIKKIKERLMQKLKKGVKGGEQQ